MTLPKCGPRLMGKGVLFVDKNFTGNTVHSKLLANLDTDTMQGTRIHLVL